MSFLVGKQMAGGWIVLQDYLFAYADGSQSSKQLQADSMNFMLQIIIRISYLFASWSAHG
jgi:hypothetical protein